MKIKMLLGLHFLWGYRSESISLPSLASGHHPHSLPSKPETQGWAFFIFHLSGSLLSTFFCCLEALLWLYWTYLDNLLISKSLVIPAEYPLLWKVTYSQVLDIRAWIFLGGERSLLCLLILPTHLTNHHYSALSKLQIKTCHCLLPMIASYSVSDDLTFTDLHSMSVYPSSDADEPEKVTYSLPPGSSSMKWEWYPREIYVYAQLAHFGVQ